MKDFQTSEQRRTKRIQSSISALVKIKDSKNIIWNDTVNVFTVSRIGAGFYIDRPCDTGQILSLLMPFPTNLRCYDYKKKLYRVWGLVQFCNRLIVDDQTIYHVGVAFIGKFPPPSYRDNQAQTYRIIGVNESGLWEVTEVKNSFINRQDPRFWISIEVCVQTLDAQGEATREELTYTENLSAKGASVLSNLHLSIGEKVMFSSPDFDFTSLATVRNVRIRKDGILILHLEFESSTFPIDEISFEEETSYSPNEKHRNDGTINYGLSSL